MRGCRSVRGSFLGRMPVRCIEMAFVSGITLILVYMYITVKGDNLLMSTRRGDLGIFVRGDDNLGTPNRNGGNMRSETQDESENLVMPSKNGANSVIHSKKRDGLGRPCNIGEEARINKSFPGLMDILKDPNKRHAYAWIRMRIGQLWPHWIKTVKTDLIQHIAHKPHHRRKVLIYLGFLSKESGAGFTENQFKGGYLGELVQWSDLITSLYLLGHEVTVASEVGQLDGLEYFFEPDMKLCGELKENPSIIFTDIIGYHQIQPHLQQPIYHYRCRVRIMDCFGTEQAYNNRAYSQTHDKSSVWGGLNLNTQQFWTMFPHSPDNSLAGFVTISEFNQNQDLYEMKQDVALVYGKQDHLFKGKADYLRVFNKNGLKLYSTVKENRRSGLPDFVTNMGYMNGTDLYNLMNKTKIFIGLGEPFEGPAPLEAIAHGAVYINPRFNPPFDFRKRDKPNERKLTSQNSYVETLGEPYVYTVSINNLDEVDRTVQRILKKNVFQAYIPPEYTIEGHLQRVRSYLEYQDFCHDHSNTMSWPPEHTVKAVLGKRGRSCKDICMDQGLICEQSHFHRINRKSKLQNITGCTRFETLSDIYFPAYDPGKHACLPQNDRELFSCVGGHGEYSRICPCRADITV